MWIIPERKVIYLAQPRTGSRALSQWIQRTFPKSEQVASMPVFPEPVWGEHHGLDIPLLKQLKAEGWRSFTMVRNHWDYIVSWYYLDGTGHMKWEDYIPHFMDKSPWIRGRECFWCLPHYADKVFKYERYEQAVRAMFPQDYTQVARVQPSPRDRPHYRDYYTPITKKLVEAQYGEEIEKYGYSF